MPARKKRLLILRHGKSDWDAPRGGDHERPLNQRGIDSASLVGRILARAGQTPDRVISSSAVRARRTAELAIKAGAWTCPLDTTTALYEAHARDVLDFVRGLDDDDESVLLVGHEPTSSELARLLTGASLRFATATIARVDLASRSWRDTTEGDGELVWLLQPKFFLKGKFDDLEDAAR